MTTIALASHDKADLQVEENARSPISTETVVPTAMTRSVSFEEVRNFVESSRPPRRPNRSRPDPSHMAALVSDLMPSVDELDRMAEQSSREWFNDESQVGDDS